LRDPWATAIPGVVVPLSLVGTFGVMYLLGYSIDNLSMMALTICTGFVVDDAIVVIENVARYLQQGVPPFEAALRGARETGFTVLAMSTSLVAVFIPILLMGGIVGRLMGAIQADQDTSFQAMQERFAQFVEIVMADPAVDTVAGFTGGNQGTANTGRMFVSLKPITERTVSADDVIARLRPKLAGV